jgi:hypothetical protein
MAEIIRCRCGQRYQIKSGFTKKRVKCRECGKQLPIPRADEDELPEINEVLEEDDTDEFEDEEVAAAVRRRKSRSRKKARSRVLKFASQVLGQIGRYSLQTLMTCLAILMILGSGLLLLVSRNLVLYVPIFLMSMMGLAGVNGRGIAVTRDYRMEGDPALVVGSILIVLALCWPAILFGMFRMLGWFFGM